jgi:hypothetical protein
MKFIIYNPATKLFDFFLESLTYELNKLSIDVINYLDKRYIYNFYNDIILILLNPHFILNDKEIELELLKINKNFKYKILYLSEPINFIIEKNIYNKLIKQLNPYCLWTYTFENFYKLTPTRMIFKIFPENSKNNFIDVDLNLLKKKNKDNIVFFGNINENRIDVCNQFSNLINIKSLWSKEEWSEILNNNLFYLNIHRRNNCKSFESFRIIPILANGGVIFSEKCNEIEENTYNKFNIIFCSKNKIYETFMNYILNINYEVIYKKYKNYINYFLNEENKLIDYLKYHKKCYK